MTGNRPRQRARARLALLCVAQFVVVLDVTIVAIALPAVGDDLGVSATGLQWVLSAYTLTFGGLLMLAGRAADLYGRRRAFRAGLGLFAAASLACALAPTAPALVAARAVQGAGAALVAPAALALLVATEPEGAARTRALAIWTAAAAGGGASGWVLGGAISGGLGWQWVFAVNVPIGLAGVALAGPLLAESREHGAPRLDVKGAVALTAGVGAVLFGLSRGEPDGLGAVVTLAPLGAGVALLALFAAIQRRAPAPLLPPGALRAPGLAPAVFAALALTGSTTPAMFLCVLRVQHEGGFAPLEAGLLFAPLNLAVVAGSLAGPRVSARTGERSAMVGGLLLVAAGAAWLAATGAAEVGRLLPAFALMGGGLGVASVASTAAGTADRPGAGADRPGLASGLLNTAAQLGSALGLGLLVAPAAAAGFAWGWAGAAGVAATAALAIGGVRRPGAASRARRSPG
jgi:MFS family permease